VFYFGSSQNNPLSDIQEIQLQVTADNHFEYHHKLKAKQTIYSLSKFFKVTVSSIYELNEKAEDYSFKIDEIVRIPFNNTVMTSSLEEVADFEEKIAVRYIVRPKENLYRISREYFTQPMDQLMSINQMLDFNLSLGEELIVGYIPLSSRDTKLATAKTEESTEVVEGIEVLEGIEVPESIAELDQLDSQLRYLKTLEPIMLDEHILLDSSLVYDLLPEEEEFRTIEEKSIALWDKKISDKDNLFVLHRTLKAGTNIEIYYPLLDRTIEAQVVGNIPKGLYPGEIDLIISPKIAQQLSIRDAKFRVDLRYSEKVVSE
jgi:LysM repeat protein